MNARVLSKTHAGEERDAVPHALSRDASPPRSPVPHALSRDASPAKREMRYLTP